MMGWHSASKHLLFTLAFSKWLLPADTQRQEQLLAGLPLSEVEYEHFFRTLNSPRRVSSICFLRATYGCKYSLIQILDQYENHGVIPKGRICSDSTEISTFPDFCAFTIYRCTLKKYFVKRIPCPKEISKYLEDEQTISQEVKPEDSVAASMLEPLTEQLATPPQPFPELLGARPIPAAAITGFNPDLRAIFRVVDAIPVHTSAATTAESLYDLLAKPSFEPLFPTPAIATEPFPDRAAALPASETAAMVEDPEHLPIPAPEAARTESVLELLVPTSPTAESLLDLLSPYSLEPHDPTTTEKPIPELSESPHATIPAESPPQPITATGAPHSRKPKFATTKAKARIPMSSAARLGTQVTHKIFDEVYPLISTATASKAPAELPLSTTTAPAADLLASSTTTKETTACLTPTKTACINPRPLEPAASAAPTLSSQASSDENTAVISSTSTTSASLLVPKPADTLQFLPKANSNMRVYIISTFIRHKPEGLAGLIPLLHLGARTPTSGSEKIIPNPQPTADLQELFLQLQNSQVQQLMQEMRDLMAKKVIQKRQSQASSLQLLRALNHTRRQRRSKQSQQLKNSLQR